MTDTARQHEALRQQWLVGTLCGGPQQQAKNDQHDDQHSGQHDGQHKAWLAGPAPRATRGLQVYVANAGALAERALAAAFPTLTQLVGADSFAGLARAFWRHSPPLRGDIGQWGAALPLFIADAPQLASELCLADVARLDWAVHLAEQAGDGTDDGMGDGDGEGAGAATGLAQLASTDPALLWLRLAAGTAVVASPYPVATIWQAHRSSAADRFAPVRAAFAAGAGEHALVWRAGQATPFQAQVHGVPAPAAHFTQAVIAGASLDAALQLAGDAFAFEPWLLAALQHGWLTGVDAHPRVSVGAPE